MSQFLPPEKATEEFKLSLKRFEQTLSKIASVWTQPNSLEAAPLSSTATPSTIPQASSSIAILFEFAAIGFYIGKKVAELSEEQSCDYRSRS